MKKKSAYKKRLEQTEKSKPPEETLVPLIEHLSRFDSIKSKLLKGHFYLKNLSDLQGLLDKPFVELPKEFEEEALSLKNPALIKEWLYFEAGHEFILDIRFKNQFPSYLLVKVIQDHWLDVVFIQDILYRSPDYPVIDEREIRLRFWGKEQSAIRLDQFKDKNTIREQHLLGLILTAAWREKEDFLVHYFFQKTSLYRQLVELTSLVKNTQTAALRDISAECIGFFSSSGCYPQPVFFTWFDFLNRAIGNDIDAMEKKVRITYFKLKRLWKDAFLNIPVTLSENHPEQALWKWCYANYWRLHTYDLKAEILAQKPVQSAMEQLERKAEEQFRDLFAKELSSFSATS